MSSANNNISNQSGLFSSPLNDTQLNQLQHTVSQLSPQQLAWVSGYFWGLSQSQTGEVAGAATMSPLAAAKPANKLTIIYASQIGNAKGVAEALEHEAQAQGLPVQIFDASDYKGKDLAKETHVVIVASTNGEGEAPDNALELHVWNGLTVMWIMTLRQQSGVNKRWGFLKNRCRKGRVRLCRYRFIPQAVLLTNIPS
jgi:sulfite reductase (NADPH) flavoprotein alpha-component